MKKLSKIIIASVFLLGIGFQNSLAQTLNLPGEVNSGLIRIAQPGQIVDTLSLWGDVRRSGRYLVPRGTNLTELISMARGPVGLTGRDSWSTVDVEVYVSRFNQGMNEYQIETFKLELNEPFPAAMKNYPLQNGDVITIKADRNASFRDYFTIIAPIISLGLTTYLVFDRINR